MIHENTLEWLPFSDYKEARKLLPLGKIHVCKYLIGVSKTLGISREVFGLREAKDFADSLSEWREPVFDLIEHLEELEKMENETENLVRVAFPKFDDETISNLLSDRAKLKQLTTNQESGIKYGL